MQVRWKRILRGVLFRGIFRRLDEVVAQNEKFIKDAAQTITHGLAYFAKTKECLQVTKTGLEKPAGIHTTAAAIGMRISENQLRVYNGNQYQLVLERKRRRGKIDELKGSLSAGRCLPEGYSELPAPEGR